MEQSDNPSSADAFEISVVIPALNEEHSIGVLIEDLLKQTLKPKEIVITDGGSTDRTCEIIQQFIDSGAPVRLIRETKSMPGRSRNIGAAGARSDWLAFTDAGIRLPADWLNSLAHRAAESSADVIYGTYDPIIDSFFTECAAIAYVPPPLKTDGGFVRPRSIVSALMRRAAWQMAGGFPEHLRSAEDLLFMNKVEAAGFKTARTEQAKAQWNIQPNLWRTFKRFVEYSRNNIRAGLFAEWQGRIFTYYAVIALSAIGVVFLGVRGLFVPPVLGLVLLIGRASKALFQNRLNYPASLSRNLARLPLVAAIIVTLDAAAFIGAIKWFVVDRLRSTEAKLLT